MAPCDNETDRSALDRIYHLSFSDEKKTSTFWNAVISYEPTPPIEPPSIEHQHPPPLIHALVCTSQCSSPLSLSFAIPSPFSWKRKKIKENDPFTINLHFSNYFIVDTQISKSKTHPTEQMSDTWSSRSRNFALKPPEPHSPRFKLPTIEVHSCRQWFEKVSYQVEVPNVA